MDKIELKLMNNQERLIMSMNDKEGFTLCIEMDEDGVYTFIKALSDLAQMVWPQTHETSTETQEDNSATEEVQPRH